VSHIVISSFENTETGDLQAQGEAIALFASEELARTHFTQRASVLQSSARAALAADTGATFIAWAAIFRMPLDVDSIDEALEDLEMVIEETDSVDDPFGELVVAYEGARYATSGESGHPQANALREVEAWLT
jgi:hypothetical protein